MTLRHGQGGSSGRTRLWEPTSFARPPSDYQQLKSTTKPVFVYVVPPSKMTNYSALTDQLGTQVSLNCATPCDDPLTHFPAAVASDRVTK